jgi:hypothetical protein
MGNPEIRVQRSHRGPHALAVHSRGLSVPGASATLVKNRAAMSPRITNASTRAAALQEGRHAALLVTFFHYTKRPPKTRGHSGYWTSSHYDRADESGENPRATGVLVVCTRSDNLAVKVDQPHPHTVRGPAHTMV